MSASPSPSAVVNFSSRGRTTQEVRGEFSKSSGNSPFSFINPAPKTSSLILPANNTINYRERSHKNRDQISQIIQALNNAIISHG